MQATNEDNLDDVLRELEDKIGNCNGGNIMQTTKMTK